MERSTSTTRAAASKTGDATRKRKRGALQDISNNTKKLSQSRVSTRRGGVGVKKDQDDIDKTKTKAKTKPARPSTRSKATVNSALSSMAATAASKAKKRPSTLDKKTDGRAKKRKLEGVENQPPYQKIQTSMLSFQAPKPKPSTKTTVTTTTRSIRTGLRNTAHIKEETTTTDSTEDKENADTEPKISKVVLEENDDIDMQDIDAPSATMSSHTSKLVRELDVYYRKHEMKYLPEADYIGTVQMDINEKMRTILVDWLVEVGEEYELDSQTFHKAVNLVDRCLKIIKINRKQFQLLGCACMMIAAKFEEVYGPNVEEFVYISDQTYTAEEMLDMEAKVLKALEYRVASTTCYGFVQRYIKAGCTTDKQRALVMYLCDFTLLYYHMVKFKPSKLVASAVYLVRVMTDEAEPWTPTLHHVTQYNPFDLQDCIEELRRLHAVESQVVSTQRDKAKAVSEKYMADKFQSASTIPSCDDAKLAESFVQYMPS
ncbi:hypothetical protein BBO99_00006799 [Phytophthora kernoviae]|uniref:Cyclin N-terminal domain-containing protein n=2 Tax=Phytophthora kernoviae TaxID=325452 RepID=A0A3R7GU55_9STRA|nr:hypothetical protein G195_009077 [Phytophthora kernoviae 00238/432]KAG2516779.1 hypothetical protein JM16_007560 [Phytophthora kernoviae]KAG2519574.1 hypothetical protein JM18_007494 [Phytophthora kernoviae]RLN06128.1 hypothetical protein BBI17_007893 [Phytophthora kernoviae]RLN77378.1 hypothetical protein BBO99_00006799 [Phytophthora kernoviae]